MKTYNELVDLFEQANDALLMVDYGLLADQVSERTLCGALMLHIYDLIRQDPSYKGYYADVEYNRNKGTIKTIRKAIRGPDEKSISINCDLILHSRGTHIEQDNLLAVEMKKSTRCTTEKNKDRERLIALTKDSFDDVWAWDGKNLPEHVCRYVLGVYYEINYRRRKILVEYYRQGQKIHSYTMPFLI